jgi:hypothetical protein
MHECSICYEKFTWKGDDDDYSQYSEVTTPCGHTCCYGCWRQQYKRLKRSQTARCPVCRLTIDRWLTRYYKPDSSIDDSDIEREDGGEIGDIVYVFNPETQARGIQFLSSGEKAAAPWIETHRELCD